MTLTPQGNDPYSHVAIVLRAVLAELPLGGAILELEGGYRERALRRAGDMLEQIAERVDEHVLKERLTQSESCRR